MVGAKHTPGPWKIGEGMGLWIEGPDASANVLADLIGRKQRDEPRLGDLTPEDHANAQLMSASPDLLAAAQHALSRLQKIASDSVSYAVVSELSAAIAKAIDQS